MSTQAAKEQTRNKDMRYYINAIIGFALMFGFGLIPAAEPITPHGMTGDIHWLNYLVTMITMSFVSILLYMALMKFVFKVDVSKVSQASNSLANQEQEPLTSTQKFLLGYTLIYVIILCLPGVLPVSWALTQVLKGIGLAGISVIAIALLAFLHDPKTGLPYLQFNQFMINSDFKKPAIGAFGNQCIAIRQALDAGYEHTVDMIGMKGLQISQIHWTTLPNDISFPIHLNDSVINQLI